MTLPALLRFTFLGGLGVTNGFAPLRRTDEINPTGLFHPIGINQYNRCQRCPRRIFIYWFSTNSCLLLRPFNLKFQRDFFVSFGVHLFFVRSVPNPFDGFPDLTQHFQKCFPVSHIFFSLYFPPSLLRTRCLPSIY